MNDQDLDDTLLDDLAADAPIGRMRWRLEKAIADPPRARGPFRVWRALAAAAVLAIAILIAFRTRPVAPVGTADRAAAVLELLAAPSTFDRLRGVAAASDLWREWPALSAALLDRVERDKSVNVRLAALGVLTARDLSAPQSARLADALVAQETAIVQAYLGHRLRRRGLVSRAELERILDHRNVHQEAREAVLRPEEI